MIAVRTRHGRSILATKEDYFDGGQFDVFVLINYANTYTDEK